MPRANEAPQPYAKVPLAPLTTLRVGGPAQWYVRATRADQVGAAHAWASERGLPVFVLGGGSNIVVADAGISGLVLHVAVLGVDVRRAGDEAVFDVGAGESWDGFVSRVVGEGYSGVETLSGIPGLVGGTPIQNVGAYGQDVASTIERVSGFDVWSGELFDLAGRDCGFAYRQSRFKKQDAGRFVICRVTYRVRHGAPTVTYPDVVAWVERNHLVCPTAADIRRGVIEIRRAKGMVLDADDNDTRSVGSFFMNPVVPASEFAALGAPAYAMRGDAIKIPAAWLIERSGFCKGFQSGSAGISTKHTLAIVNRGGATSGEIVDLACRIKRAVFERFGLMLRPEPVFAGFGADERIQFLQRDAH